MSFLHHSYSRLPAGTDGEAEGDAEGKFVTGRKVGCAEGTAVGLAEGMVVASVGRDDGWPVGKDVPGLVDG